MNFLMNQALDEIILGKSNGVKHILDMIIKETKSTHGLIAEKMKGGFLRFHAISGINDDSPYMRRFLESGYIDFTQPHTLHNRILTTTESFVCNDIPTYRKGCPFNVDHPKIKSYCSFAITKGQSTIGVISIGRSDPYDEKQILSYLEQYKDTIANLLILFRKIQDFKDEAIAFIANMGDEMRIPLDGIVNVARILDDGQLHANQRESVNIISRCSLQLLDIVNDVIDYSNIMAGRLKLDLQPCSIKKCVDDIYQIMRERAHDKGITLIADVDSTIPELLREDTTRITQILVNVIGNAIKFTKKGTVKFTVKKIRDSIQFMIVDTGIGMTEETLHKILNPCFGAETKVGLGLAITYALVNLHKGSIKISSHLNKGTTVEIILPISLYDDVVDMENLKSFYERYPILIIDNDVIDRTRIFDIVRKISNTPIMTNNISDAGIYLSRNNIFGYKIVIINTKNFSVNDLNSLDIPYDVVVLLIAVDDLFEKITLRYNHHIAYPFTSDQILIAMNANYILSNVHHEVPSNNVKVLVVLQAEDKHLIETFKSLGYLDLQVAYDGLNMFIKVTNEQFDICFVDLKIPIIDGITATRKIRESDNSIAIVAMTPSMSEVTRDECFKSGMNGYITSPINKLELEKIMNTVVMKKIRV